MNSLFSLHCVIYLVKILVCTTTFLGCYITYYSGFKNKTAKLIPILRTYIASIIFFYFLFLFLGGYTVILYSEGMARDHQTQCMGVYRSTGYHNGRPVYKQDEGENYLFYHNHCWLIGPQVGKDYAWIRNPLEDQRTKKSSSPSHSTRSHNISKFSHKKFI